MRVETGESVAIVGPSGSGKTTLLNAIAGITPVDSGTILISEEEVGLLREKQRRTFRLRNIGQVFQFVELLPELTVLENAALPARLLGVARSQAESVARAWLDKMDIGNRCEDTPEQLSGGEQQRVGIARALVNDPILVLADEPTGMLDEETSTLVFKLLLASTAETGAGLLVVTHDRAVAAQTNAVHEVTHGTVQPLPPTRS